MGTRTLVTGGGRGLGLELVRGCVARGHRVAATVRDPDASRPLHELAREVGDRLVVLALDLSDATAIPRAVGAAAESLGGLDLVVNNAGVNARSLPGAAGTVAIETLEAGPMLDLIAINTVAPLLVARAALPWLRSSERPRIVNISSWLGSITEATGSGNYAYGVSKAGLNMATRLLANELRADGVTVVAVNPGWVRTSMGGPRAELRPDVAAGEIIAFAESMTMESTGRFVERDGSPRAW